MAEKQINFVTLAVQQFTEAHGRKPVMGRDDLELMSYFVACAPQGHFKVPQYGLADLLRIGADVAHSPK